MLLSARKLAIGQAVHQCCMHPFFTVSVSAQLSSPLCEDVEAATMLLSAQLRKVDLIFPHNYAFCAERVDETDRLL